MEGDRRREEMGRGGASLQACMPRLEEHAEGPPMHACEAHSVGLTSEACRLLVGFLIPASFSNTPTVNCGGCIDMHITP